VVGHSAIEDQADGVGVRVCGVQVGVELYGNARRDARVAKAAARGADGRCALVLHDKRDAVCTRTLGGPDGAGLAVGVGGDLKLAVVDDRVIYESERGGITAFGVADLNGTCGLGECQQEESHWRAGCGQVQVYLDVGRRSASPKFAGWRCPGHRRILPT
jgi:hypothetical protein